MKNGSNHTFKVQGLIAYQPKAITTLGCWTPAPLGCTKDSSIFGGLQNTT